MIRISSDILASAVISFAAGTLVWTLLEYLIHRFLGHYGKGKNPFGKEHLRHHATTTYFAPNWKKAAATIPIYTALGAALSIPLGIVPAVFFTLGLALMYVGYETVHRRCHTHPPTGPYSRWVRLHHFHHHFRNPRHNHGVSNPFWDHVFRTYDSVTHVKVPRKHAMNWLTDPATGELWPQYATDYELTGKNDRAEPPAALVK